MKTRKSLRMVLLVATVAATVPIGWAVQVQAQGAPQGSPQRDLMAGPHQVQGTITALDESKGTLTLDDGTRLAIPPGAQLPPDIKEGAIVKASFEERSGQKVLTGLEVQKP